MVSRSCVVGLDAAESCQLASRFDGPLLCHEVLPSILVRDGQLFVESNSGAWMVEVDRLVYHGIFEEDHDFLAGLALWDGPCLPNAAAMMDCRLKLPCLARALKFTRFGTARRGYAAPGVEFDPSLHSVAKWGNWHCGENKLQFDTAKTFDQPTIVEPYFSGQAVRVLLIGDQAWQIRLCGETWLKSIHHDQAAFTDVDPELRADTEAVASGFGLEIIANDYIIGDDGQAHLLEVNHIPNVTRFPGIWQAYSDYAIRWLHRSL